MFGIWIGFGQNIENTLFGRSLVRVRAKIENYPSVIGICLELGQEKRRTHFVVGLCLWSGQK